MKLTIVLLVSIIFISAASGQSLTEIKAMQNIMDSAPAKKLHQFSYSNSNEIQFLFSGLFLAYKSFISSQDGQSCSFIPSCSEYGIIAVKKNGVIEGMVGTFDRLLRCNGLSPELYKLDKQSGLLIDYP